MKKKKVKGDLNPPKPFAGYATDMIDTHAL